ncbi:MAG: 2Fe-2S iron-sulfur cluster binding domain-containing protein [Acaryochloridaceae cyanobacterium SU_2_1]|nr:2Fe-2S iron-sulfur cluster binding domain-containing protein [Acaryochloridaceae cyanobacterium SU_2_1]NJM95487.1 2Fe-2S iron-sulfur cluster binding domain-containing protein [Acaryochloridaceae cyanobacterium CSU_5_19]
MNSSSCGYCVTLVDPEQQLQVKIDVGQDELILDIAEEEGIELPYSCRSGSCFDCLGKLIQGAVEHTAKSASFLQPEEIEAGYVLLCSCSPSSDCTIQTHQAEEYLK